MIRRVKAIGLRIVADSDGFQNNPHSKHATEIWCCCKCSSAHWLTRHGPTSALGAGAVKSRCVRSGRSSWSSRAMSEVAC